MTKPILNGFVQPAQSLSETSFFFIDSDVEDTGSETGDSFDDDGSPVDSSVESVRASTHRLTSRSLTDAPPVFGAEPGYDIATRCRYPSLSR